MRLFSLFGCIFIALATCLAASAQAPAPVGHVSIGKNQIARAWLAQPTARYQHFAFGDRFHAATLVAKLNDGSIYEYEAPQNMVFEDRHVRLADLNNDGTDELIVVMSSMSEGSSLAVFSADRKGLQLLASTPHIGTTFRWLNPAGIEDYDGDGNLEIALVEKPHLSKQLQFWRLAQNKMELVATMERFSNHKGGSPDQLLSASIDINGDGIADLLIPDADRSSIMAVTLVPSPHVIKQWNLPEPTESNFLLDTDKTPKTLHLQLLSGDDYTIELD